MALALSDIVENKKTLNFTIDDTVVRVLDDTDLIAIGNTIALEGGLNVLKDSLSMKSRRIYDHKHQRDCRESRKCR